MIEVSKITVNGKDIEEKDGEIFINGRHVDSGKYRGMWLSWMFLIGAFCGASGLAFLLILLEYLLKTKTG